MSGSTYCSYQSGSPKCSIATIGKKTSAARAHQRQLSLDRRPKGRKGELSRQRENLKSSSRAGRGRIILGEGREGGGRRSVGIGRRLRDEGGGAGDGGMVRTVDGSRKGEGGGKESGGESRSRKARAGGGPSFSLRSPNARTFLLFLLFASSRCRLGQGNVPVANPTAVATAPSPMSSARRELGSGTDTTTRAQSAWHQVRREMEPPG